MIRTYYHGSNAEPADTLTARRAEDVYGVFDGLFLSLDRDVAESHGTYIYAVDLDDDEVLFDGEGDHEENYFEIVEMLKNECWRWDELDEDQQERLFDAVAYDEQEDDELMEILQTEDLGATGWELQRLRGHLAEVYDCKAVEMEDEHGSSFLTVPGITLTRIA